MGDVIAYPIQRHAKVRALAQRIILDTPDYGERYIRMGEEANKLLWAQVNAGVPTHIAGIQGRDLMRALATWVGHFERQAG